MEKSFSKYVIIGAGLSGLTSGYLLDRSGEIDFTILESRDRIGGRIHTKNGVDFGATWFQTHHKNVLELLEHLSLKKFHQYSKGRSVLVYSSMAPAHEFESDPNAPAAFRIAGGSAALTEALANPIADRIKLDTAVIQIKETNDGLAVITENAIYHTKKVIVTIPPRIATRIVFEPDLPETFMRVMDSTHTWMSNAIKVGMTFKNPFWRKKGMSGTMLGQIGAVTELYDHSNSEDTAYTLMGFVNEGLRDLSPEKRKARIIDYISKYLGEETHDYLSYEEKDWSQDRDTSCNTIRSVYISPEYGHAEYQQAYMSDRLLFSGAETATQYGGYMDGAILKGIQCAEHLINSQDK